MKSLLGVITVSVFAMVYFVGCAENTFSLKPSQACSEFNQQFGDGSCVFTPNGVSEFSYTISSGAVDILFVTDNSGSMYQEQVKMADRFPGFIDSLTNVNFQIAMVTTDASENRFLPFPSGVSYLASTQQSLSTIKSDFINTVKRSETLSCDQNGTACASGDERGIYTVNQALNRSNNGFFRGGTHLAVVILSDEDERTNGGLFANYPLDPNMDTPESLVSNVRARLGSSKVMSVHSVIIRPGDTSCLAYQNSQTNHLGNSVAGYYGTQYSALSHPSSSLKATGTIIDGVSGSICSSDYGQALGDISSKLRGIDFTQLPCEPIDGDVQVTVEGTGQALGYTLSGQRVTYTPAIPAGVEVRLEFKCPRGS